MLQPLSLTLGFVSGVVWGAGGLAVYLSITGVL